MFIPSWDITNYTIVFVRYDKENKNMYLLLNHKSKSLSITVKIDFYSGFTQNIVKSSEISISKEHYKATLNTKKYLEDVGTNIANTICKGDYKICM